MFSAHIAQNVGDALGRAHESNCRVMSPMEVEIKSLGPVMGGLLGAGVTAFGSGGGRIGGRRGVRCCAKAGVAKRRAGR